MCLLSNTPRRALNQYTTTSVRKPGRKTDFCRNWNETDQSSFIIQAKRKCKKIKIKVNKQHKWYDVSSVS